MAFPTIQTVSSGTQTSNSNSWTTPTYPSGVGAGDLLLLLVANDGTAAPSVTGFTVLLGQSSGGAVVLTSLAKKADGSESGSFTISLTASEQGAWRIFRISGWHGDDPAGPNILDSLDVVDTATGSPSANPDPPSLNPANWDVEDTLWFAACGVDTSRTISVYPLPDNNTADVSGGAGGATLGICSDELAQASLDPGTFTISASDDWAATTVAVRPAAGGGPSPLTVAMDPGDGISSAESFGSQKARFISRALAIATGEAFAQPLLRRVLRPAGLASAELFGTPWIPRLSVAGLVSAEAFGSPHVLFVVRGTGGIVSAQVFGANRANRVLSNAGTIASAEAFGNADRVNRVLRSLGVTSAEAFGSQRSNFIVRNGGAIASAQGFGQAMLKGVLSLRAVGAIGSLEAFGDPKARFVVRTPGISSGEAFGILMLPGGVFIVTAVGAIPSAETFGLSNLIRIIYGAGATSAESFGGLRAQRQLRINGIPSAELLGAPKVLRIVAPLGVVPGETFGEVRVRFLVAVQGIGAQETFGILELCALAHPDSDFSAGTWTTAPLWEKIDEGTPDDADFVQSALAPSADTFEVTLQDLLDPGVSVGHVIRYRISKDAAGGGQVNMTVRLMQGGTEVAAWTHSDLSDAWATFTQTLSGAQADAISDYANLRLRFTANQV